MGYIFDTSRRGKAIQQKARQSHNDANDQQPFRCVECGEAVSHINRNDCACIRKLRAMSPK